MIKYFSELNGLGCDNTVHASPRPAQIMDVQTKDGVTTTVARCQNCYDTVPYSKKLQQLEKNKDKAQEVGQSKVSGV